MRRRNRNPEPDEVRFVRAFFFFRQIEPYAARIVVSAPLPFSGAESKETPISKMRGHWQDFRGIRFMPTFHPA